MKITHLLVGALALTAVSSVFADVTIEITGSSAFRSATLTSIKNRFAAAPVPSFSYAHEGASLTSSTRAVFRGSFPGVSGTTTIRTCFTGSVEGIDALVNTSSPLYVTQYLPVTVLTGITDTAGGTEVANASGTLQDATAEFAFSDVSAASSPYAASPLLPSDAAVGVVTFTMIASKDAPASLTNVTNKQFQALFGVGFVPLSLFTGDAADTNLVFATGRNDGSGTRTTYLAETGYGIANPVNQYMVVASTASDITQLQRVPGGSNASYASKVWGQNIDGNGGYSSGGTLSTDLTKGTANVEVLDADGSSLGAFPLTLVSWLGTSDAAKIPTAKVLAYNGVSITPNSGGLSAADVAKVTNGQYTAWGYEYFYRRGDLTSGDAVTIYNAIVGTAPAGSNLALGSAGIPLSSMNVARAEDGGVVLP